MKRVKQPGPISRPLAGLILTSPPPRNIQNPSTKMKIIIVTTLTIIMDTAPCQDVSLPLLYYYVCFFLS